VPKEATLKVLFDEDRALVVFKKLAAMWKRQEGIYRDELLPQNLYPLPSTTKAMANYLMYGAIPMRGAVNSDDPFKWIHRLYETWPSLFEPNRVVRDWSAGKIEECFFKATRDMKEEGRVVGLAQGEEQVGAGSLSYNFNDHVTHWLHNSHVLARDWGGNLLNVYKGVSDFEQAFARVNYKSVKKTSHGALPRLEPVRAGLMGMRRKIFSLLTIWLQEKRLVPCFPTPIPVDFHALRILWSTNIISFEGLTPFVAKTDKQRAWNIDSRTVVRVTESIVDQITMWSQQFFSKHDINHMAVNPALWVLSRQMCAFHPQARMPKRNQFIEKSDLADAENWPKSYRNECASCPVTSHCTGMTPAGIYYVSGFLVRLDRAEHPQGMVLAKLDDIPKWGRKANPKERTKRQESNGKSYLALTASGLLRPEGRSISEAGSSDPPGSWAEQLTLHTA
jgi:hypothetical protein